MGRVQYDEGGEYNVDYDTMMVMMIMMMLTCRGIEGACTIGRAATQRYRSCQSIVASPSGLIGIITTGLKL